MVLLVELEMAAIGIADYDFWRAVDLVLDEARGNANETVYIERAASEGDWNAIAIRTLESNLAYESNKAIVDWFAAHGVSA